MKTIQGDLLLNNCTSEAARFFCNFRTPAAIIAAASLQSLLHLTRVHHKQDRKRRNKNRVEEGVVALCHTFFFAAFVLSIALLIFSATAELNIHQGEVKPMAENTFDFLNKEFRFEFAAVRVCALGCMFSLFNGLGCHLLLEYNLFKEENVTERLIVLSAISSVLSGIASYVHCSGIMNPWDNWFTMTIALMKMTWVGSLCFERPLSVLSLISFGVCCGLSLYHCFCLYRKHGYSSVGSKDSQKETETTDRHDLELHHVVSEKGEVSEDMKVSRIADQ